MKTLNPEIKKFKLGLRTADPGDARSLSRLLGPFNLMAREDPRLEIVLPPVRLDFVENQKLAWCWDWFTACDAVLFLDPFTQADKDAIFFAKTAGTRVWVDYIDDLFAVRLSNPGGAGLLGQPEVIRQNVGQIIEWADVTSTTTRGLRARLPHPERVVVIPESCRWPAFDFPRKKLVTWRGLASHEEDLETALPAIKAVAHDPLFADWEWAFFGDPSWKVTEAVPKENLVIVPSCAPYQFMQLWAGQAPFLHLVPLADNQFNRGKSNLAWLEASAAGAAVLAPEWHPEFAGAGVVRYHAGVIEHNGKLDLESALRQELARWNGGAMHPCVAASRERIYPDLTTPAVNRLRWAVLDKLGEKEQPQMDTDAHRLESEVAK